MSAKPEILSDLIDTGGDLSLRVSLLDALFDEDPEVAFFLKDCEGRYLSVNRSLAERHGFSRKEHMIGKRPVEVCPGVFGQVPTEQDAKILRSGRGLVNHLEMQWLRPNRPVWCLTTKLPLREGDEIVGLVGFSRDLKEEIPVGEIPPQLALALDELETNIGKTAGPAALAQRAGLTQPRLARLMKRFFGMTPSQYVSKARIKNASQMLLEKDASIAEIALDCGFSDHSAFTRAFRSIMGLAPSRYREEIRKGMATRLS